MLRRPKQLQVAALCHRRNAGRTEILLITSRGTGRWVIPKGWPMDGKNAAEAAVTEAWEEAGVRTGPAPRKAIGSYVYDKIKGTGLPVSVETLVYPVAVEALEEDFPEASERTRQWTDPREAAGLVDEEGLKRILLEFAVNQNG